MSTNNKSSVGGLLTGLVALAVAGGIVLYAKNKFPDTPNYSQSAQTTSTRINDESRIDELLAESKRIKTAETQTFVDGRIYSYKENKIIGTNYEVRANYLAKQAETRKVEPAQKKK